MSNKLIEIKSMLNQCVSNCAKPKMHYFNNRLAVYFETITQYVMFEFNTQLKNTLDEQDISFQKVDKEELFKVNPTEYFNIRDDYPYIDSSQCDILKHYINLLNSLDVNMEITHSYVVVKDNNLQWLDINVDNDRVTLSCKDFSISCKIDVKDIDLNSDTNPLRMFLLTFINAFNNINSSKIRTICHSYKIYKDNCYHYYMVNVEYFNRIYVIHEFDNNGNYIGEPSSIKNCITKLEALKKFLTL